MKPLTRTFAAGACLVAFAVLAFAGATVALSPGGSGPDGNYSDRNGSIDMHKGAAATWADGKGKLEAKDPAAKKKGRGSAIDNKVCTGVIDEAVLPAWIWGIASSMNVASDGYISANFQNKVEGKGRGELAVWGDGGTAFAAREVTTTNQNAPGPYDINLEVGGAKYTVTAGGSYHRLANPLGLGGGYGSISASQAFTKYAAGWRITYESRALGATDVDFTVAGPEKASFSVDQINGQWQGQVMAWDFDPNGPHVLGVWLLD